MFSLSPFNSSGQKCETTVKSLIWYSDYKSNSNPIILLPRFLFLLSWVVIVIILSFFDGSHLVYSIIHYIDNYFFSLWQNPMVHLLFFSRLARYRFNTSTPRIIHPNTIITIVLHFKIFFYIQYINIHDYIQANLNLIKLIFLVLS